MFQLEDALRQILETLPAPTTEPVPLAQAVGRVVTEQVRSPMDLPAFDNSSMDGYAVRAGDVAAALPDSPVRLRLQGRVAAGQAFADELAPGRCVRIFTGSPLPRGADAVVMQEETRRDDAKPDSVLVLQPVEAGENVRRRGLDVQSGAVIAEPGRRLSLGQLCLLAAVGATQVNAGRQPRVCLLATGSELREGGQPLKPGEIYESNRIGLAALVARAGGLPQGMPIVADSLDATRSALEQAFEAADLVVTCGGVSVGELDFVKAAFEALGGELQFWKVAIKPGKPFVFGRLGAKFLFGLPGNPVSAVVTFVLLVRPALLRWQGAADVGLPSHHAILGEPLSNPDARRHFMRVCFDEAGRVRSAGTQASHVLSSLANAKGLVDVPPRTTLAAGETVKMLVWD